MDNKTVLRVKDTEEFSEEFSERFLDDYREIFPEAVDEFKAKADKTIERVKNDNPVFKDIPLEQLKGSAEFRQALKEYLQKNPLKSSPFEVLKSIIPESHTKPNNKLANTISKEPMIGEGAIELVVSNKKAKNEVRTKVMLNYDHDEERVQIYKWKERYTPYDREVYDGVVTLYAAGNNIINPAMVYRAMNGLTDTEYVNPEALFKIRESLDKSMSIKTIIDYTAEAQMYNKDIKKTIYEGRLLAAEKVIVDINGEEYEAYKLLRSPILYEYAQVSGQILTVPMKVLKTKNAVRSTEEVIIIRGHLLRQIGWMKNTNTTRSDHITYQGVYDELGVSKADLEATAYKNKTRTIRNHVKAILDEWKEQAYIMDHAEYKEGKTIIGVIIMI